MHLLFCKSGLFNLPIILVVKDILINEKRYTVLETTCLHKSLVEYDTEYIQLLNRTLNTNNENNKIKNNEITNANI